MQLQVPFMNYFDAFYLCYEISTFFMDVHYLLEKSVGLKSKWVYANGACFVLAFLIVRNGLGTYMTYRMLSLLYDSPVYVPLFVRVYGKPLCPGHITSISTQQISIRRKPLS